MYSNHVSLAVFNWIGFLLNRNFYHSWKHAAELYVFIFFVCFFIVIFKLFLSVQFNAEVICRASWRSVLELQTRALLAESSEWGFESWSWHLCSWQDTYYDCFSSPRGKWVSVGCRGREDIRAPNSSSGASVQQSLNPGSDHCVPDQD